jgi:hypothetical protein
MKFKKSVASALKLKFGLHLNRVQMALVRLHHGTTILLGYT